MKRTWESFFTNYRFIENCKTWKKFWILIDLSNGNPRGRTYFWVFPTKKLALKHKRKQGKYKFNAKLSKPIKVSA